MPSGEESQVLQRIEVVPAPAEDARDEASGVGCGEEQAAARLEQPPQTGQRRQGVGKVLHHVPQSDGVVARRRLDVIDRSLRLRTPKCSML